MSNMKKLGTCLAMVALAILALIVIMPDAYALPLTGPGPNKLPLDTLSNAAAAYPTAMHTIAFTTATGGLIKSVDITFPDGFVVSGVGGTMTKDVPDPNIPVTPVAGDVTVNGQVVTYTVDSEVSVPANTAITIDLTNVVNGSVGNYTVTVATKDPFLTPIDGPTVSEPFAITSPQLANVTDTPNPTIRGVAATHTIGFTTVTKATIASVDILFDAKFDVSKVTGGTVDNIGAGTVAVSGKVVTYTVTTAAEVAAGIAIKIGLKDVDNAPAGSYTVTVRTKDAADATIDGPTVSNPFTITAVPLTAVKVLEVVPNNAATPAAHTIGFTTATKETIKSVDITFPANFDVSGVPVAGVATGIGPGTVAVAGQKITYTVTTPVEVADKTPITIKLTGVVNGPARSYTDMMVVTKDASGAVIDGPTAAAPFTIDPAVLKFVTDTVANKITGQTTTHTIAFTQPATVKSPATIKSVDITFPANFDVSGVPVAGVATGIGPGTVAVAGQKVTYTVTTPAPVNVDTAITIELTPVVNAPAGTYTVTVETKNDTPATIGGPTVSDTFSINPAVILTSVTNTVVPTTPGLSAVHTIAFTQPATVASPATIKSVDITFPTSFTVSGVVLGTVTNIGAGDVTVNGKVVTYTVTTPAPVTVDTAIKIELTNVVNAAQAGSYTVTVETKDDTLPTPLTIGGPTVSAPFKILTPGTIEFIQLSKYYTMPYGSTVPAGTTHYTTSGVFPGDFDNVSETSADSKPDQFVIGALKKGAQNVPILKVVVTGGSEGSTLESLTVSYTGTRVTDVGSSASLYEAFYHTNGDLKSANEVTLVSIASGTATFEIPPAAIPADGTKYFIIVLDIASNAASKKVDLRVKSVNRSTSEGFVKGGDPIPSIGTIINPNPDGSAYIDASAPTLIVSNVAPFEPSYDTATKILTLKFNDVGARDTVSPDANPVNVTNPRINVIDKVGDAPNEKVKWMVDLSKIRIRKEIDSPSITLSGSSLLYPTADYPFEESEFIPEDGAAFSEVITNGEAIADQNVVKIKLTAPQDATLQQDIVVPVTGKDPITGMAEIFIGSGALADNKFGNAIAELEKTLHVVGDATSPSLVPEKPVSFDYKTQVLTLTFNESIDASEVESANIYIMNYVFDPEADADPVIPERIIVDLDSVMDLRDASVEEGYGVIVSMTLTPAQRDILKGDHPQVYLNAGAVEDIASNPNNAPPGDIAVDSVDEFIKYIDEKYAVDEYPVIGADDVYVTPPILSGVDSVYHGKLMQVSQASITYPDDYHNYDAVLDLKFTEELSTDVDATKITVTNENGEQPFTLTQSQYDSVLSADSRIVRLLLAKRSKTSQKAKIAFWQLENSGIDELHIEVGAKAVEDIYGNSNELMEVSKRIHWLKDSEAPRVTDSTSYGHSSQVLKLAFDECIDLESDNLDNLVDLGKIKLEAFDGDLAGREFTLNKDEDLIKAGQKTGVYLSITLSDDHRDIISSWDFAGGKQFILKTSTGAVYDIAGNTKPNYSAPNYPRKNWTEDAVKPTFVSPAFYSIDQKMFVLRFSEPIYDGDLAQYKPDLTKIKVHPAAEKSNIKSLETATFEVSGDSLKIDLSGTSAAIVDARKILEEKANPQVDIQGTAEKNAAVHDLAKNHILTIADRSITLDLGGPRLSSTGNTYEHISLDEEDKLVTDGLVTLSFAEVIDGKSIKLSKIKLQAGTTSVDLSGAKNAITGGVDFPNATTFKMKITDNDKVGRIASLQREYDTLHFALETEAVADLAGNPNVVHTQVLEEWTGDSKKPEIELRDSYYIHDLKERSKHYARLVLVFDEPMDTENIDASGVVITDGGNKMVTLTAEEIKPDQALSTQIEFNLTDPHREEISVWGEPMEIGTDGETDPPYVADTGGLTRTELSIYLAENSVTDTAGNSVVVSASARVFAKAAPYKTAADERKYDKALAADAAKDEGVDYSTWEQDLKPAEFVSAAYNANTRVLTVTFDEWMDVAPVGLADSTKIRIYDADYLGAGEYVDLAGGATENGKTKTVTFTLTTEKGVAVNALKTPLYIELRSEDTTATPDGILDVGPARDIAGQLCERLLVDADTKILDKDYTADGTAPTLVISNGDDTTYRDKGKDFDAPDDITGLLSLVFNEGVDKDYNSINASKIRLSNTSTANSGFALTQEEIYDAAGRRVYPLAPKYVHIIQFDLNDEHWDTVAGEKWSTMYIHMDAGAISDTSGNGVAAVTVAIHDDHYYPDEAMPEVDIITEVSTASNGQKIDITATAVDDSPIVEVRLYYQIGGQVKTYVVMENTSGDTYEGTIPDTAVTNKGLCYYVWAKDQWDNVNITDNGNVKTKGGDWWYTSIPGGFNVKVTGTSVELPANTLPAFDAAAVPSTYRMISVPIVPSPAVTSTDLFLPFGEAPGVDWVSWKYTGGSEYNGYAAGHITPFTFTPGAVAAWIGTVNPDRALTVEGETSQISDSYDDSDVADQRYLTDDKVIKLSAGWNQIAVPFNFSRNWDKDTIPNWEGDNIADVIYWFSGDKSAYNFASLDSTVPNQDVFKVSWTGSGVPDNSLVWSGWPGSLDPWGGYWIYSNREGAVLEIDPTVPGKGVLPATPTAPSVEMPYNWSVKVIPESGGTFGTAKFAGIVSDASNDIDSYDVMDLPALPGQAARLAFIIEDGDYLQDMKAPADEMFWNFKASAAVNTPVTLRFDPSAVPSEYRTVLLIDTVTEAATDLRKASSYAYKSSEKIRNFKLIISKAHIETYIVPKHSVLLQNYPNPFNPETWVPYRLATAGDVKINIYNVTGQLVRTLELGRREAGSYTAKERAAYWDGRNVTGERVASGVYFYNVQSGSFHATKRMVIVK